MKNREEYLKFLDTGFWLMLRDRCLERDGHKCTRCGSKECLQAHHVQYPADWYDTVLEHLVTLCRECHEKEHCIWRPYQPRRRGKKWRLKLKEKLKENWKEMGRTWSKRDKS